MRIEDITISLFFLTRTLTRNIANSRSEKLTLLAIMLVNGLITKLKGTIVSRLKSITPVFVYVNFYDSSILLFVRRVRALKYLKCNNLKKYHNRDLFIFSNYFCYTTKLN